MEPDEEDVFHSLCDNNERLLKEMNVYLASISTTPDVSIKTTSGNVGPKVIDRFDVEEGAGNTNRNKLLDSATGGETDDDSLVAMAQQMDAASIISDPLDKGYASSSHLPLSPRMEISAGMEEMLAQFTNSDPSIKKTKLHERFNSSDSFITRPTSTLHTPNNVPPLRSPNPKQMKTHSPVSTYPTSLSFDKYTSKSDMKRDNSPPTTNILPFPSFENVKQQRRLSLERLSDMQVSAANVSLQQEKKRTKSASKYKEKNRRKDYDLPLKRVIPPSTLSERESTAFIDTNANNLRKKGWPKKQPPNKDRDSDDEMCGVGINTRVHDEKEKKCKTSKEKRHRHLEKRQHQNESKSTSNTARRSKGKNNSRRRGEGQSDKSKPHSEERRNHKTHRRMGTSQSRNNVDSERVQTRANSSSPNNYSRRQSDGDNHSTYDSDDETQFFYESTDDDGGEEGEVDSEDDMKAVGTSVVDAVKDLNERSAVAKVKSLFKLHH